jgi:hypothetical protein
MTHCYNLSVIKGVFRTLFHLGGGGGSVKKGAFLCSDMRMAYVVHFNFAMPVILSENKSAGPCKNRRFSMQF